MSRRRRTPWDRIIKAANQGKGLRLTARDVGRLAADGAIETRGLLDRACYDQGHNPDEACLVCGRIVTIEARSSGT